MLEAADRELINRGGNLGTIQANLVNTSRKIESGIQTASSVDVFLESHKSSSDYLTVGKIAIAYSIANAERNCSMFINPENSRNSFPYNAIKDTWYNWLGSNLFSGCDVDLLEKSAANAKFIIFNYDRCIEHYLFHAIKLLYPDIDSQQHKKTLDTFEFVHPYGALGPLGFQDESAQELTSYIGPDVCGKSILDMADRIKIYTERQEDNEFLYEIERMMHWADVVVFLGFGFIPQNIELITVSPKTTFTFAGGTAYGLSPDNCEYAAAAIEHALIFDDNNPQPRMTASGKMLVNLAPKKCSEFLADYERAILG